MISIVGATTGGKSRTLAHLGAILPWTTSSPNIWKRSSTATASHRIRRHGLILDSSVVIARESQGVPVADLWQPFGNSPAPTIALSVVSVMELQQPVLVCA